MQALAQTSSLGTPYTADQVTAQMAGGTNGSVHERWQFDWLDFTLTKIGDLTPYLDRSTVPEITHDSTAAVSRRLKFRALGTFPAKIFRDFVRPVYYLTMPDGGTVSWSLGVFTVLQPKKEIWPDKSWWDFDIPDITQFLLDAEFTTETSYNATSDLLSVIKFIIASYGGATPIPINVALNSLSNTLPATLGWVTGDARLKAVTELLGAINWIPPWADENAAIVSSASVDYSTQPPVFTFSTLPPAPALIAPPIKWESDVTKAFNDIVEIGEDPSRAAFSYEYKNQLAASPVSIPNYGRPKVKVIRDSKLKNQGEAQTAATRAAQEAAQLYAPVELLTRAWPVSQHKDVYQVIYQNPDEGRVQQNYIEIKWQMRCRAGEPTLHTLLPAYPA
ncbi:MAG: hypothetical protein ACYDAY_11395 [Candidatus Dormibacteria bacterium]